MQTGTTVKEKARHLVDSLPDDATWDDLMYAVHVRQSVEEGLADADAGRVTSNDDVRASFGLENRVPQPGEEGFKVMPWVREIRDRMHEATKHMSAEEKDAYVRERADRRRKPSGR